MKLSRIQAIVLALLVTTIWSFSWVLIKFGLQDAIPPLTFAGLRYSIAAVLLLCFVLLSPEKRQELFRVQRRDLLQLLPLGFVYYTLTQGLVFLSLQYLTAASYSLILNFTSVAVLIGGVFFLKEYPSQLQIIALGIFAIGLILYFYPTSEFALIGLVIGVVSMLTNAVSSVLGRAVNRKMTQSALIVTVVSMGFGAPILLVSGLIFEGWLSIGLVGWGIIIWLAIVHTALAFTLWNLSLTVLTATESSLINSTMLVQTAILGWVFLGELLSVREIVALCIATVGIVLFQIRKTKAKKQADSAI